MIGGGRASKVKNNGAKKLKAGDGLKVSKLCDTIVRLQANI